MAKKSAATMLVDSNERASVLHGHEGFPELPVSFRLHNGATVRLGIEEAYRLGWSLVRCTINMALTEAQLLECCREMLGGNEGYLPKGGE